MCIVLALFFPNKLCVDRSGFFKNDLKETPRLVAINAVENLHSRGFWEKNFTEIYETMKEIKLRVKKTP